MNHLDANGLRVVSARVTIPPVGTWVADIELSGDLPLVSPVTLTLGNLVLVGVVIRDGVIGGDRSARLIGGTGGWRRTVTPLAYTNPAGVPASMVLGDLATEAGEVIDPAELATMSALVLGQAFTREATQASTVLRQVPGVGGAWWVDPLGVTHVLPRLTGVPIVAEYLVEDYKPADGWLLISTEDLAAFVPGGLVSTPTLPGPLTLGTVTIAAHDDGVVRVEAMVAQPADRLLEVVRAIVRTELALARLTFANVWEYQVASASVSAEGVSTIDGYPVSANPVLPALVGVQLRPALPGASATPAPGSLALVAFVNGEPGRPVVLAYDGTPAVTVAFGSASVELGGAEALPIARAPALQTWAPLVVSALAGLGVTVPPLGADVAALKSRAA